MNVSLILVMSQGMAETEDKEFPVKPDIFHQTDTETEAAEKLHPCNENKPSVKSEK